MNTYDKSDGFRILVDRVWPRGLTKQKANIDLWLKEIAPSTDLRKWFNHEPEKWAEFKQRYKKELSTKHDQIKIIADEAKKHVVTLVYGAKDEKYNNAVVLQTYLKSHVKRF